MSLPKSPNIDLENDIVAAYNDNQLVRFIITHIYDEENTFREAFIKSVNSKSINLSVLLSEFTKVDFDFFQVKHLIEGILSLLTIPPEDIAAIVAKLFSMAGQDMSAGFALIAFENYLKTHEQNFEAVLSWTMDNITTFYYLLPTIVRADTKAQESTIDLVKNLVSHESEEVRKNAIYALAQIDWISQQGKWSCWLDWMIAAIKGEETAAVVSMYVYLLFSLAKRYKSGRKLLLSTIEEICLKGNQLAIFNICRIFHLETDSFQNDFSSRFPIMISKLSAESRGSIKELDYGLANLLKTEDFFMFLDFLERILIYCPEITMGSLEYISYELSKNEGDLARLISRWLSSSNFKINAATAEIINQTQDVEKMRLVFEPTFFNGGDITEIKKLLKRVIGFLFYHPTTVLGFCFSIINVENRQEYQEIIDLIINLLGTSFPGTCIKFLESINHPVGNELITKITDEIHVIEDIKINEFQIESVRRYVSNYAFATKSQAIFDEAKSKSVLLNLIKTKHLLFGTRSIGYDKDYNGNEGKYSFELEKHEYSLEIPRLLILSPITLAFELDQLKTGG